MVRKIWMILWMVIVGTCGLAAIVEAAATIAATEGPVQVFFNKEQIWKPLGDVKSLTAGDQILTGQGAFVELRLEDGSELYLHEETQLALNTLEFSRAPQTRNFRFTLFWGNLRASASAVDFHSDTFEIRTDTIIVGLKSSRLQMIAQETASPQQTPNVTLRPIEGKFEIRQIETGHTQIECCLNDPLTVLAFFYHAVDVPLELDARPEQSTIAMKSQAMVQNLRAFLTPHYNSLLIENLDSEDSMYAIAADRRIMIGQNASAVFADSSDNLNQLLEFEMTRRINAVFRFLTVADAQEMLITCQKGCVEVDGKRLAPGKPFWLVMGEDQETPETPIIPPAPESRQPLGGGTPLSPTPTPTSPPPPAPPRPPRIPTASPVQP